MLRIVLAGIAFLLAVRNRGNEPVQIYWTLVTAYWILNYIDSRKVKQ